MVTCFFYTHDLNWCKKHSGSLSLHLGLWRMLEVPDWRLLSWSWYGNWSLIKPWTKFWLSILILNVQRASMYLKSSFGALEDVGGSWLAFGIFIWMWIYHWSLVHQCSEFWLTILTLKVQRTSMSFKIPFLAFENAGGSWLGFACWSWFGYGHWSLLHPFSEFCLSILILKLQRTSMSSMSWIGALEDTRSSWIGFCILILIWIWSMV